MKSLFLLFCEVSLQVTQLFLSQLLRHIGIDVHCSRYILMAKDILHELDIRTGFAQPGCKGMPLRYNKDKRKNPVFSRVSAFVVAYSIPFPTLIVNEKSVE